MFYNIFFTQFNNQTRNFNQLRCNTPNNSEGLVCISTKSSLVISCSYTKCNIPVLRSIINIDNLISQHPRHIGDMQPSVILLGNELGETDGVGSLHSFDKGKEHRIIPDTSSGDIRRTPHDMVAVGDSAHGGVECWTTVARGDDDG